MRSLVVLTLAVAACSPATTQAPTETVTTAAPTSTTTATVASTTTSAAATTSVPFSASATSVAPTTTTEPARFDPFDASIGEMQTAMDAGTLSATELVEFYLARIAAYDPDLNVFISFDEGALDEAAALDEERAASGPRGPLHGIPIVLKDNIGTADLPTTAGSAALASFVPATDAFVTARLRAAGAIILGKVNMQEWARSFHTVSSVIGATLNPYGPTLNPGGSSGGTAVAVTTQMAAGGLGTDTCGSVRIPASYAGLYGLRPTIGLIDTSGVIPLAPSEDTVGPMTRSVADMAVILDTVTGTDPDDPDTGAADSQKPPSYSAALDVGGLQGARIGVIDELFADADPRIVQAVEAALDEMAVGGAVLVPVAIPGRRELTSDAPAAFLEEFASALDAYLADQPDAPYSSLDDIYRSGLYLPEHSGVLAAHLAVTSLDTARHDNAEAARSRLAAAITAAMDSTDVDALAYPTMRTMPVPLGATQSGSNCTLASVSGLPALTVPAGLASDGLPVGLELLGRPFAEPTLLAIASGYEAVATGRVGPPGTPPLGIAKTP